MGANANEAHRPSETLLQGKDLTESINELICPASILIGSTRERIRPQGYFRLVLQIRKVVSAKWSCGRCKSIGCTLIAQWERFCVAYFCSGFVLSIEWYNDNSYYEMIDDMTCNVGFRVV